VDVPLHFAERAFALHLLLQRLQGLVDVVVADENLNQGSLSCWSLPARPPQTLGQGRRRANKKKFGPAGESLRDERGEISEAACDVHAAREGFRLPHKLA
jgi:hypothetical protein